MKFNPIPLITTVLLALSFSSPAQQDSRYRLSLRNGSFTPEATNTPEKINALNNQLAKSGGQSYVVIQFEQLPADAVKRQLQQAGIELLDYVPNNAYTAIVSGSLKQDVFSRSRIRAVVEMTAAHKLEPRLLAGDYPARAVKVAGSIDVWISFPKTFSFADISNRLKESGFDIIQLQWKDYRVMGLRVSTTRLQELAAFPFIEYVQTAPKEDEPVNDKTTANGRANVLQSPVGRNLRGEGVVIGVGDNADPSSHIDFAGRLINRAAIIGGAHGIHVMGIAGGGGIIGEKYRGYAPKARIIAQGGSNVLAYSPAYVQDFNMVITNNSYGNVVNDCATFGVYDLLSRIMDLQEFQMPNMQHVFSAGNSGSFTCSPYPSGMSTVLGSYQTAKNVLTVGNIDDVLLIRPSSSKGPVRDGRTKPEIVTMGHPIISSVPFFTYGLNSGTSMSAPGVAGGLALLYQRYRQLNGNADPSNALMKAIICNGATDLGRAGPDFKYGFGRMNLVRSVTMIEKGNYFTGSVSSGGTNTHSITIPAGSSLASLKVMLYWNDSAAAVFASQTLVNDLDLEVTDPSPALHLPFLLDTIPARVDSAAAPGVDHINNIEQVVINNPGPGTYTVSVKGTTIPFASHNYYVVFDTIPVSTTLMYPIGGERWVSGDSLYIGWDSYGNPANDFRVQYSTNNGSTWTDINTNVPAADRQLKWFVPSVITDQAMVKVIHNGTGLESTSSAFTILGVPVDTLSPVQCEGYISIGWTPVTGATGYEVMMLRGDEMVPVATTNAATTTYSIGGLSKDTTYWVTVRALLNGNPGRRALAVSRQPNTGTCAGNISNNDLKVDSVVAPLSGRLLTSSALTATTIVSVRVKNLDDAAINTFNVKYSVNGGAFVSEAGTGPINAGATYTHNFAATFNFAATGVYILRAVVENTSATDPVAANDTMTVIIKQLPNAPIVLVTGSDFLDNIEAAADSAYYRGQIGLAGADRYDFNSSTAFGRVRTFVNSTIAYSGIKALTLDSDRFNAGGTADSLKGTFNLLTHAGTFDDIRLDFVYKQHAQGPDDANKVWIRGDDQKPWVEAYDLFANQELMGVYKKSSSIQLSDLLAANAQDFSTSFQIRFGQFGHHITADDLSLVGGGYSFDDIHLYKVDNDMQMVSLDTPTVASCALSNITPVRVTVRNNADTTITNIPVKYSINGGSVITETIASVAGNTNLSFTFATTANLSAFGAYVVRVWVDYPDDSYSDNDTVTVTIRNSPVVTSYPYLENFEASNGSWYAEGKNNSWQYGTPASIRINRAASGIRAWKTNLTGNYNDQQLSYLYSPCYDITGMSVPTLSFSVALDLEDCGGSTFCDGAYMEYSADGVTWSRLGAVGQGTNWYNRNYPANPLWSVQNYTRWHVATIPLPTGLNRLRLRFVVSSDPFVNREGIAIDDIHIYDNIYGIYAGPPYVSNTVNQASVSGSSWVDFTDGGKLIASVNPNGQNLGSTNARAYINTTPVRIKNGQFYHDRNITIKPANRNLADSATVRFYFLDIETELLINASGCPGCFRPSTAYQLGVSKYNDADTSRENGTLADDGNPGWLFIVPANVTKVPFDRGYYAEFKVKDFSEFWLNNGGLNNNQSLPTELLTFTAHKKLNKDVLLEWKTASEINTDRFEIELAKGNNEFQNNQFIKIAEVAANGNSSATQQYNFTDIENNKSGVRYYRLKIRDLDGKFSYSAVRPVVFDDEVKWQVYPNPSEGIFNFVYQANDGEDLQVKLYDVNGKLLRQTKLTGNGFVQKHSISLESPQFTAGLYLLEVATGEKKQLFKLIKK